MNRFIYSITQLIQVLSDSERERLEATNQETDIKTGTAKIKIDLAAIDYFYENDGDVSVCFKNGTSLMLIDSFNRIDRLHNEYLQGEFMTKKQADEN